MICIECNDLTGSDDLICPDCLQEISGYDPSEELDEDEEPDLMQVMQYARLAKQAKETGNETFDLLDPGFSENIIKILGGKWDLYAHKKGVWYEVSVEKFEKWLSYNDTTLEEML